MCWRGGGWYIYSVWEETSALLLAANLTQNMLMTTFDFSIVQADLTNFVHSNFYSVHSTAAPLLKAKLTGTPSFPLVNFCHKNRIVCHLYDHSTYHSLSYKFPSPRALLSL